MLRGGNLKTLYELRGEGMSIRKMAETLGISRNTVRKYVRAPGIPERKRPPERPAKLDPYLEFVNRRLGEGIDNCAILLRELHTRGYTGGMTILKEYVKPFRRPKQPKVTMRFETAPGEQAQVDWGLFRYTTPDGRTHQVWAFVMVLSWSRAIYVEFVERADVATFLRCHVHAFEAFGGVPLRCLYDNAKVVVQERDEQGQPIWNERFLDFSLRLGFDARLCHPYRPQTKGRVESGVKYVRGNFWPTAEFTDRDDLNQKARAWSIGVANERVHGTTGELPRLRLLSEQPTLQALPPADRWQPFLRENRKVQRDGFVRWAGAWYGVPASYVGREVQVQPKDVTLEIWADGAIIAMHPCAVRPRQRLTVPGQWTGIAADAKPAREPIAKCVPDLEVEQRPLAVYGGVTE